VFRLHPEEWCFCAGYELRIDVVRPRKIGHPVRQLQHPPLETSSVRTNPSPQVLGDRDPDDDDHRFLVLLDGFHQNGRTHQEDDAREEDRQSDHVILDGPSTISFSAHEELVDRLTLSLYIQFMVCPSHASFVSAVHLYLHTIVLPSACSEFPSFHHASTGLFSYENKMSALKGGGCG